MPSYFPAEVEVRSSEGPAVRYHLAPEFYAIRSSTPLSSNDRIVQELEENLKVFQGSASPREMAEGNVWPVYRAQPSGMFAVPTGRLWVRFAEGINAAQKREAMAHAGFRLEESPAWAAHTAWLRATSGKIADALDATPRLAALPDVEHVEPQMLFPSARKNLR